MEISADAPNNGSYDWTLPDVSSDKCLVRISGTNSDRNDPLADTSDEVFEIIPDTSPCGGSWFGSNYSGSYTFTSVTYGNSTFIAVGSGGVIMTGPNATKWTLRTSGTTNNINGVIYGDSDNLFVAVGAEGMILTSPNGTTWTTRSSPTSQTLRAVAYGAGTFIAVGDSGTILTSPNGTTWTDQSPDYSNALYGIIYGNNQFAAVGSEGMILTSPDGSNWTKRSSGTTQTLRGITYGDSQFVAVGDNSTIVTGTGGSDWVKRTVSITADLFGAAYGNSTFVIVGEEGKILTGSGTGSWNQRASKVRENLYGAAYGNLQFAAVGTGTILYSTCTSAAASSSLNTTKGYTVEDNAFHEKPGVFEKDRDEDKKDAIRLISPNGYEILYADERFLITWESDPNVEHVNIEYSPDNGSTYLTIASRIPNTGYYEWQVPPHISSHCLVRVSDADSVIQNQQSLLYELKFKSNSEFFTVWLGDAQNQAARDYIPYIPFHQEADGNYYMDFNGSVKEIQPIPGLWNHLKVMVYHEKQVATICLNESVIFENVPLSPEFTVNPAISFATGPGAEDVQIDDLTIRVMNSEVKDSGFITIFKEGFDNFKEGKLLENSGWKTTEVKVIDKEISEHSETVLIDGTKALKIKSIEGKEVIVVRHFNLPGNFPFDVSDKPFEIRYNDHMTNDVSLMESVETDFGHGPYGGAAFTNTSTSSTIQTTGFSRTQSSSLLDTYYIYSYDGKLLAEYDHSGNCVRDYIYSGNQLIAEYRPQTNTYYYYMSDQINTTRIITDGNGNVVYSALHGPYGDVQKVWTNTYDPKLKFSGKEREPEAEIDYFGARYYDHNSYRFLSVDPLINKEEALVNPQACGDMVPGNLFM